MSYASNAATALNLITKKGQSMTLTVKTAGVYDPATGTMAVTEVASTVKGVVFDFGTKEIDGTLILAGDKNVMIASSGITAPGLNDTLTFGSVVYTIKRITELNPAGTSIIFECQVRK